MRNGLRNKMILVLITVVCFFACPRRSSPLIRVMRLERVGDEAFRKDDYAEAEKQYKAALVVAEEEEPENSMMIPILHSLSLVYIAQKKDAQAEELLRRRLAIAEKAELSDPGYLAIIYDDLVLFYLLRNKYAEAEPLYRRALLIREKAFGPNHSEITESLEFYAALLRRINRKDEAAELQKRADLIKANSTAPPQN